LAETYKGVNSRFFADRVPGWLSQHMSLECPQGENSVHTPEVPCQAAGPRFHWPIECTLHRGSAFNTDSYLSGGFHTQFAGSPLFVEATLSCRLTHAGVTTTTTHLQRSSCPLLALFNLKMNRFPDCAMWRRRTSRSNNNNNNIKIIYSLV
jgi:hypothetical protein